MAVAAEQGIDVGTTATLLCEVEAGEFTQADSGTRSFAVIPQVSTGTIYFGPAGVTTGNGVRWDVVGGPLSIDLEPGEALYAVVASGTLEVDVLSAGR